MQTQTANFQLSDDMRSLLASLVIAESPMTIENVAVRAGVHLETAKASMMALLESGHVRRLYLDKKIQWEINAANSEVLSEVTQHICSAYARWAGQNKPNQILKRVTKH
jgi:hypothetical protein